MNRTKLLNILSSLLVGVVFTIVMLAVMVLSGAVSLTRTELVFSTSSAEAVYDGKPLTNHNWSIDSGVLKEGHRVRVNFTGRQTTAGESDNTIQVQILDAAGADVTGDYTIRYNLGRLKVTPKMLTVTSKGASKEYDGTPLINPDYEISDIVPGHNAYVLVMGSQTNVGYSLNTITTVRIMDRSGADVTNNYQITKREEPLIITSGGGSLGEIPDDTDPDILKNTIIYRVFSNRTGLIYLKTKSCGEYTGGGFLDAKKYTALLDGKYSASYLMSFALQAKNASIGEITVQTVLGSYALPYYMAGTGGDGYVIQTDDAEITGSATEYTVQYYVDDVTPVAHNRYTYRSYEDKYSEFVYANYLDIDAETKSYMNGVIAHENLRADDPDIINKVAEFIKGSAVYDLNYDLTLDASDNVAVEFLRDYKKGVCRHYAAAATMLYRALDIPARYTTGAIANAVEGEWTEVNALMLHAWVEVYIDGIGWQMVEVTGGSAIGGGTGGDDVVPDKEIYPVNVDKKYDGTPLKAENAIYGFEKYAEQGYRFENLKVSGTQTEIGTSYSTIESITVYDAEGNDVTREFILGQGIVQVYRGAIAPADISKKYDGTPLYAENELFGFDEFAAEGYWYSGLRVSGSLTEPGMTLSKIEDITIYDASGSDVTDEFKLGNGEIRVYRDILYPKNVSKRYDGTPLYAENMLANFDTYADMGYYYVGLSVSGMRTEIGISYSTVDSITIYDAEGNDVTMEFVIGGGSIQVYRAAIAPADVSKKYDGTPLRAAAKLAGFDSFAAEGYTYEKLSVTGSRTEPGISKSEITSIVIRDEMGNDVTDEFVLSKGDVHVYRDILSPVNVYKRYDGEPLYAEEALSGFSKYAIDGYWYKSLSVSGVQTDAGTSRSTVKSIVIYDPDGKDVTSEFIFGKGIVQVYRWEINVTSASATFEYGDIGGQSYDYTGDTLSFVYKITVEYTADYSKIGEQQNSFRVTVKDMFGYGNDITDQFKINKTYGKLNIERRSITVTAGSAEKAYDGTPLTCSEYYIDGELCEGDIVYRCEISGEQINMGSSQNVIDQEYFEIHDAFGNDVTDKYRISVVSGTLRVTRPK